MKTAVAILNWNGKHFLEKFLPGVVENSPTAKVVVIDNNSTDGSKAFLESNFPSVELICLDKNYGFSDGYNLGIKEIKEEYIVLLNSDVEVTKGWIEPLEKELDENPDVAACQPKIKSFDQKEYFEYAGAAGGMIDMFGYPFCQGRILHHLEKDTNQYQEPREIFWATGACMMVRKSSYINSGGLDSDFFAHMEEIDLCWRFHHGGMRLKYIPESTVYHVGGGTLQAGNPRKAYLNFRNNLFLLTKNLPGNHLVSTLFLRLILDGLAALMFLLKGSPGEFLAVFKAHLAFYSGFRKFRKKKPKKILPLRSLPGVYHGLLPAAVYLKGIKKTSELGINNPK